MPGTLLQEDFRLRLISHNKYGKRPVQEVFPMRLHLFSLANRLIFLVYQDDVIWFDAFGCRHNVSSSRMMAFYSLMAFIFQVIIKVNHALARYI